MTRTMYDAITPANIPVTAQMVAGYVDGKYAWTAASWARFPHSVKARIAVFSSTNDGHILDVEAGCSSPANAPGWVVRRRAKGIDPTVYCSLSAWPTVRTAFHNAGVTEPHWWIAAYPGNGPNLYPGAVAHQYANPGPVDISVVADYWPGVDPKPAPVTVSRGGWVRPIIAVIKAIVTRKPTVKGWQELLAFAPARRDGVWGPATDQRSTWMVTAARAKGGTLAGSADATIRLIQRIVGAKDDGAWGPASRAAMTAWTKRAQAFLGVRQTGSWDAVTQTAYAKFRTAHHR